MTRDELTAAIAELLAPLSERIAQLETALREQTERRQQLELERTIDELAREIGSWRYNNDTEAIPPRIAQSYALMLARMPEDARTELLLTLKHNPPITMPITPTASNLVPTANNPLTPLQQKYADMLGVSPDTFLRYNKEA